MSGSSILDAYHNLLLAEYAKPHDEQDIEKIRMLNEIIRAENKTVERVEEGKNARTVAISTLKQDCA